jgi:hypothetical protein
MYFASSHLAFLGPLRQAPTEIFTIMILLFAQTKFSSPSRFHVRVTQQDPGALTYVREDLGQLGLPYADIIPIHTPAAHGN